MKVGSDDFCSHSLDICLAYFILNVFGCVSMLGAQKRCVGFPPAVAILRKYLFSLSVAKVWWDFAFHLARFMKMLNTMQIHAHTYYPTILHHISAILYHIWVIFWPFQLPNFNPSHPDPPELHPINPHHRHRPRRDWKESTTFKLEAKGPVSCSGWWYAVVS